MLDTLIASQREDADCAFWNACSRAGSPNKADLPANPTQQLKTRRKGKRKKRRKQGRKEDTRRKQSSTQDETANPTQQLNRRQAKKKKQGSEK